MAKQPKRRVRKKRTKQKKISPLNWNTTDSDEIERRKQRAQEEKLRIEDLDPDDPYFGNYRVYSKQKMYHVEIRSLNELRNSCDCFDYKINGLGTCKHIERILYLLRRKGVKKFKQAAEKGSPHIEIYCDVVKYPIPTVCISWPNLVRTVAKRKIASFFSDDGALLGGIKAFERLKAKISINRRYPLQIQG